MTSKRGRLAFSIANAIGDAPLPPLKPRLFDSQSRKVVRASELQPGDFLIGSRRYVRYVEQLSSGRVRVDTETLSRKKLTGNWHSTTTLGILR